MDVRMIPLLPSNDLDDVLPFYLALGFRLTYRQARPNPCLGVTRGDGFDLQFFGMPGFDPEQNYSSVIVAVEDTQALYDELAAGLRAEYGKLPISGLPRITRPRRKQGTSGGFSVVDPAGNWLRIASTAAEQDTGSRFERVLLNAARQGDSHGDVGAAIAVLEAGLRRHADATDQEKLPVLTYLAELLVRDGSADRARGVLTEIDALDVDRSSVTEELGELRSQLAG